MDRSASNRAEGLSRALSHPLRTLERWSHERQTAVALGALDDATLKDIGVHRCDIPRLAREGYANRTQRREAAPSDDDESALRSPTANGESSASGSTTSVSAVSGKGPAMSVAVGGGCALLDYDPASA
jgi:uncharacterized protein YjiS (DUF1127 family)